MMRTNLMLIPLLAVLAAGPLRAQSMMGEAARNPATQDASPEPEPGPAAEAQGEAQVQAARSQEAVMDAARRYLLRRSVARNAAGSTRGEKIDLYDSKTGLPLDATDALKEMEKNETLITEDEFGPIGPGRRERLARIAGLTAEQARQLWPLDDPHPVSSRDMAAAARIFQGDFEQGAAGEGDTQESANARLAPAQDREKKAAYKNTVLTDAEASFAVYAALGFPFPIRVGRVNTPPPNGFVIFNPQLFRVDLARDEFKPRHFTYRWMEGNQEVLTGQADVTTYYHLQRPTAPVTHVMISSDDDVMAYALVGRMPPTTLWEVRNTLLREVVDMYSFLRPAVKLYGLRWTLMPGIGNIMDNPQTKAKMAEVMEDLGFIKAGQQVPAFSAEAGGIKAALRGQGFDE